MQVTEVYSVSVVGGIKSMVERLYYSVVKILVAIL